MESREPGRDATARMPHQRWWLLAASALLAAMAMYLLWPSDAGTAGDFHALYAEPRNGAPADDLAPVAATIIDDFAPIPAREASGASEPGAGGGPFGVLATAAASAPPAPVSAAGAGAPPVPTHQTGRNPFAPKAAIPASAGSRSGGASARAPAASAPGEPALMSTLLRNIRAEEGRSARTSEMDDLVRDLESGNRAGVARDASATGATRTRSQQIQQNLRECPPPNTTAGLKCRQAICAVYAGRDPACPAR